MSVPHHGDKTPEQLELIRRFMDQQDGKAKREYSAGRMGGEDDGDLAFAMRVDDAHKSIIIDFGKPIVWIGLGVEDAKNLIDQLSDRILYLTTGAKVLRI